MEMTDELGGGGGGLEGGCQTAVESWKKGLGGLGEGSLGCPDQQHTSPLTSDLQGLRL